MGTMNDETALERTMNRLTDMDWGWWPFLALRPPKNVTISLGRLLVMSLAFGLFLGGAGLGVVASLGRIAWERVPAGAASCVIGFFVAWGGLFRTFWNRRAARLQLHP